MHVQLDGVRFDRDGRVVLDIPALTFRADHTTVVLGPNGAGKTTLLRLIAGLEHPTHGHIAVGGTRVDSRARRRADVAYVFQEHVFLRQSVHENLELGLRLRRVDRSERDARIRDAAQLLGIEQLLDRRADQLSGGEGRRASLARALCLRSPLVLLDEPLAGLDPATYARLLDELPQLLHAFGATTVLVTHNHLEALRLGEDLAVLVEGRIHAAGPKREVMLRPATPVAAEILGYTVIASNGRQLAVRSAALRLGPGPAEFWMVVEAVLDLVDHREIVGSIGSARVHVIVPADVETPGVGERMLVSADRVSEVG